jgi:outer membrane protein
LKKKYLIPVLAFGAALAVHAQNPPTKVGVIHVQEALLGTKDGQKAAQELQGKFAPKRSELEKKQGDINSLQDQLRKGSATMNDEAKNKLMREIDGKTTSLKRDSEDFDADVQEEEGKVMQELGAKMMKVLEKYATDNGFGVILDVSNPQTGVLWRAAAVDITAEIIALYDKANPAAAGAAPAATTPAPRPAAPARTPVVPAPAPRKQ